MKSIVCVLPSALKDSANELGELMGEGPNTYTVALSNDGTNVTHWGVHTWGKQSTLEVLSAVQAGVMPDVGFDPVVFQSIVENLEVSMSDDPNDHFTNFVASLGLTAI